MDIDDALRRLEEARERLTLGFDLVLRQRDVVSKLEQAGRDGKEARELLIRLEANLALLSKSWDTLHTEYFLTLRANRPPH